jgi:hypothetical protein
VSLRSDELADDQLTVVRREVDRGLAKYDALRERLTDAERRTITQRVRAWVTKFDKGRTTLRIVDTKKKKP